MQSCSLRPSGGSFSADDGAAHEISGFAYSGFICVHLCSSLVKRF